jgi:NADP-dependent 3-hydroxy acid dehydrogenase YdfG
MSSSFYDKKTAVITGGSSGIGKALALKLAESGANVFLIARDQQRLGEVLELLRARKVRPEQRFGAFSVDISDAAGVADALEQVKAAADIDILLNNAGVACCDRIENLTDEQFIRMMQVNYFGMVGVTRALLPHFRQRGRGTIVNVSSLTGAIGIAGYAAYAPSKAAVIAFSECLRNELSSATPRGKPHEAAGDPRRQQRRTGHRRRRGGTPDPAGRREGRLHRFDRAFHRAFVLLTLPPLSGFHQRGRGFEGQQSQSESERQSESASGKQSVADVTAPAPRGLAVPPGSRGNPGFRRGFGEHRSGAQ